MCKNKNGKELTCNQCGISVYVPEYRIKSFKFCSRSCAALSQRVKITSNCEICGNEFEHISSRANKAKYCSRKCYYKSQLTKGTSKYTCKHCGKEFLDSPSANRVYCSISCTGKSNISEWRESFTIARKSMLSRGMIDKCERCGYDEVKSILGVHHKDRNRKNNSLDNLEILCPNCHSIEHDKHICH